MADDARKYPRYQLIATAVIRTENDYRKRISSLIENISLNGIGLRTYRHIDSGTETSVELIFMTRRGMKAIANVKGRVAWISQKNDFFSLGISLDEEVSREKHPILYEYYSKGVTRYIWNK
ncbi:PilZ domain protein [bacterium BMS3Abin07]|nr:PilZ domain protein [bacterium BMS3Abin07]GBE32983.1 PilZ domain protein [bacterium BMS3Bbin05]HDL20401.1 PilZ domain-containing protein [Nitrospirota bacterium]